MSSQGVHLLATDEPTGELYNRNGLPRSAPRMSESRFNASHLAMLSVIDTPAHSDLRVPTPSLKNYYAGAPTYLQCQHHAVNHLR